MINLYFKLGKNVIVHKNENSCKLINLNIDITIYIFLHIQITTNGRYLILFSILHNIYVYVCMHVIECIIRFFLEQFNGISPKKMLK